VEWPFNSIEVLAQVVVLQPSHMEKVIMWLEIKETYKNDIYIYIYIYILILGIHNILLIINEWSRFLY
jgi:hypothetical protein